MKLKRFGELNTGAPLGRFVFLTDERERSSQMTVSAAYKSTACLPNSAGMAGGRQSRFASGFFV